METLLFGPDSVWVNICYGDRPLVPGEEQLIQPDPRPMDDWKYEELTICQEEARKEERLCETLYRPFAGAPLMIYPNGGGLKSPWRFILRNDAVEIKLGAGVKNGIIGKVRFSAKYLWARQDLDACLRELHAYLVHELLDAPVYLSASEIHICADTVGYDFAKSDWQEGFIRRSAFTPHFEEYAFVEETDDDEEEVVYIPGPDKLHMRYRAITGFSFGTHKSIVSAVIYNKTNYIKYKAKDTTWFHEPWKTNGWDGQTDVWREEFRFKRAALKEAGINSAYDLVSFIPGLWQYATQRWLRYVVPSSDTNRTRWQIHDAWLVVQSAYHQTLASAELDMGPIVREHTRVANMDQMTAQIVGCFITLHAWRLLGRALGLCADGLDLSEVLHDFLPNAEDYLAEKERKAARKGKQWNMVNEVRYKQALYQQTAVA